MPVTFVYRTHYEGALSKRVLRFEDASVLAWFQRVWARALTADDANALSRAELGGFVYGFSSLIEAIREKKIAAPKTVKKLRALLDEHLYTEGGVELDEHTMRVLTDDDEVQLAYYLFDDQAAEPERVAYLLHDDFPLPTGAGAEGDFECPVDTQALEPAGSGDGCTWAVILTFYDSESFPTSPVSVFEGVRLPGLVDHLRAVEPSVDDSDSQDYPDTWPLELRLLRAAIQDGDGDLAPALRRYADYPLWTVGSGAGTGRVGLGPQGAAWAAFVKLAGERKPDGEPARSRLDVSEHIAQAAVHASASFGYQQLFVFDDLWASANPALAASLLRYASGWDPWNDDAEGPESE